MEAAMDGAESLVRTAQAAGVEVCFANPGTTELTLVRALDRVDGMRAVPGLFEGVCTGAADGYARMTGRAAMTLLHLGPGLANGLANLHNARRAGTPVLNVVGDHATWHLPRDPAPASDIAGLAARASGWVRTAASSQEMASITANACAAALSGRVATLIAPADCQWGPGSPPIAAQAVPGPWPVPEDAVTDAAKALTGGAGALLLGGAGLSEAGLRAAARVAAVTGCELLVETLHARAERGIGLPDLARLAAKLPYPSEAAAAALAGRSALVLAGAREPVSFFGDPDGRGSTVPEGTAVLPLAAAPQDSHQDVVDALERLADHIGAPAAAPPSSEPGPAPQAPTGALSAETLAAAVASAQPEGAIVVDESAASGVAYWAAAAAAPPHTCLGHVGGALGQGLPLAVGAAVGCPGRPVIALEADGSGMYTLQALWTMARCELDVTAVISANHAYGILQTELQDAIRSPGSNAAGLLDLGRPDLDWLLLAEGMGVPGRKAATAEALVSALDWALGNPGPHLIEAELPRA